jgi:GT2 family glycosyltransferase/SAM-dependent methyltransferase
MFNLNTLKRYFLKSLHTLRHHGLLAVLKLALNRLFPHVEPQQTPLDIQQWVNYYRSRPELHNTPQNQVLVSILVLTYNNLLLNQLCLQSIYCNTTYSNFEVIVVDNASTDGTPAWLREYAQTHPNLHLILNVENRGFAGGNNQAAREARGEYLIFLNNDTVVTRGWVERLLIHLESTPEIGLVGPVTNAVGNEARIPVNYQTPAEMEMFAALVAHQMKGRSFEIRMLAFYCVMARKSEYESFGGLDERYSVGMFEDDDIAVRFHQEGFRTVCVEDVFIHHFHRSSFGKLDKEIHQKIFSENQKKYEEKWARKWEPYQFRTFEPGRRFGSAPGDIMTLEYRCNICGRICKTPLSGIGREKSSCRRCGSTVRTRAIVHILSTELFGESLVLGDFPNRPDLLGWGMSDASYSDFLPRKLNYVNTFYHKEPRLDITAPLDPEKMGTLDFLISTEVFEHINPPVSIAFENARRLLKANGVFIFSVPYTLDKQTHEHFPELHEYEIIDSTGPHPILKNITKDGREQLFDDLVFHGGPGATLEMRVFSQAGLQAELKRAGFENVKVYSEPCWEFGIYWHDPWSLPMAARISEQGDRPIHDKKSAGGENLP